MTQTAEPTFTEATPRRGTVRDSWGDPCAKATSESYPLHGRAGGVGPPPEPAGPVRTMSATRSTEAPTTRADRYDFDRLPEAVRDQIARSAVQLFDGSRTRGACWKIAMAEYRLTQPRPTPAEPVPASYGGWRATCSCGWDTVTNSKNGLTTSTRAHSRSHSKQRRADLALMAETFGA